MDEKTLLTTFLSNGISFSFIATEMGVDVSTLNKWFHNKKGLSEKNRKKLIEVLFSIALNLNSVVKQYETN